MTTEAISLSHDHENTYSYALQPWLVCFAAACFFFYEYMQLTVFNAINPALMQEFHMNAAQAGAMSSHYFYANVLFLFPAGLILDRFSTRKIIIAAMIICTVFTYLFAVSTSLHMADFSRLMTGVGGAFALLSCVRLASRWFPAKKLALIMGLIVTLAMAGGIVSQTPMTYLTITYGWRDAMIMDASLGVVLTILIGVFVKNYPPGHRQYYHETSHVGLLSALKQVFSNANNWLAGIYTCVVNLPLFLLGAIWGSLYLMQVHHFTHAQSSYITTMLFVGMVIGSPLIGWIPDHIQNRKMPMVIGAILSLAVFLIIMYIPHMSLLTAIGLFLLLGILVSSQIIGYPLIAESNPRALTGAAEGIGSVLIMSGGILQGLFGYLMDYNWNHTMHNNVAFYSVSDYRLAMMIMVVGFVLGIFAATAIKETHARALD